MLTGDENICKDNVEGIEQFSTYFWGNVDYMKYKFGSNYVPAEIVISMKEEYKKENLLG